MFDHLFTLAWNPLAHRLDKYLLHITVNITKQKGDITSPFVYYFLNHLPPHFQHQLVNAFDEAGGVVELAAFG